ncbi:MAG: hypothetical protein H7210_03765 [Pyrinomonadaceae bacterium]|nr:hypothetical protein [Phycisphaerales bacterium]
MLNKTLSILLSAGLATASVGTFELMSAQPGVPSQPGTPSKPAQPSNPTPRPSNPQPQPANPTPRPANPQPQPANPIPDPNNPQPQPSDPIPEPDPTRPGQPTNPPGQPVDPNQPNRPNQPIDPNQPNRPNQPIDPTRPGIVNPADRNDRYQRPFAFQSPQMEVRFNQSTRRLLTMEQKLLRSQEELLKRLGEIRQLSGERQMTGLFDLVQQMLKDQGEMAQYLVQSRTAWTGDMDSPEPKSGLGERHDGAARPAIGPNDRR